MMNYPGHILSSIMLKILICISLFGLTFGCMTANPKQESSKTTASMAIIKCAKDNKRDVVIHAVDGKPTVAWYHPKNGLKEIEVEEGYHNLDMICAQGDTLYEGRLEFATIPNHTYQIRVTVLGYGAKFEMEDLTNGSDNRSANEERENKYLMRKE